jgi:hypothetical protein
MRRNVCPTLAVVVLFSAGSVRPETTLLLSVAAAVCILAVALSDRGPRPRT